jgi:outer membrane protein insertion porin family
MKNLVGIVVILSLMIFQSCSVQRFLPEGERLYRRATIKVEKHKETAGSEKSLKKILKPAALPKPNKFFLGQPYKVWFWYVIGEPKRETGLRAMLRKKLGEPPVLSSRINAKATAENMQSYMENLGYFHTTVQGDTSHTGSYFIKAFYTAQVQPQYKIGKIEWVKDSSVLLALLESNSQEMGLLKTGNPYRLSDVAAERDRLDLFLKTRGYYYFNPDYLMAYADSTVGNRMVDLFLSIKKITPEDAKFPYTINSISVFPQYSLSISGSRPRKDTLRNRMEMFDSIFIRRTAQKFKPQLFAQTITYRPGSIYNSHEQNATLNRLINLGVFKFVKNTFEKDSLQSDTAHRLNASYYLTPAKKKSIQAEINGFTKENNYYGSQVSGNWRNRNTFGGAEQLGVKVYGGFETTSGSDSIKNSNYRLGTEVSLKIPRFYFPFIRIKENNFYPPITNFLMGYEWFRKDIFFTKNVFRFQYEFTWKPNLQKQFTIAPVALSYLQATAITDSFIKEAAINPSLLLTVYAEALLGSYASYTYNSSAWGGRNRIYFNAGIDLSGNIAGLITGAKDFRSKRIFNVPFAQYVKLDADFHFTRRLTNSFEWANRVSLGIGLPYGNSRLLPFTKLYTIGGSNSLRGFRSRSLGPGTHKPTAEDQRLFQLIGGDFRLLANTEMRIPLTKQLSAALFMDAGNIWTKDTLLFGDLGKLTKNFCKEIAVATGIGLRFDATVLLIRADLGLPLRKPYLPDGRRWVLNEINFGSKAWRRENLILNIAIGLPF